MCLIGKSVSGNRFLQFWGGSDVTRVKLRHRHQRLALHGSDLAKPFRHVLRHAVWLGFRGQNSGVHAEKRNPTREGIGKRFKHESREWFIVRDFSDVVLAVSVLS